MGKMIGERTRWARKMTRGLCWVLAVFVLAGGSTEVCHAGVGELKVNVSRKKGAQLSGFTYDNIDQIISFTVKLYNKSLNPIEGLELEFVVIGRCYSSDIPLQDEVLVVLARETKKVDVAAMERKEVDIGPWTSEYDRTDSVRSGAAYDSYALILRGADGEVIEYDTDRKRLLRDEKDYEKVVRFRDLKDTFNDDLKKSEHRPFHLDVKEAD